MKFNLISDKFSKYFPKIIPKNYIIPILRGPLRGYKYIMGSAAGYAGGISIIFNLSEPKKLESIEKLVNSKDICFDIGGNIGINSLLFSKIAKQIYIFEPYRRNIFYLFRIIHINNVLNVKIIPKAVSDENGFSYFIKGDSNATGKLNGGGNIKVPTISIDTFCLQNDVIPSFLKIDVEGYEFSVLKGGENILKKNNPKLLIELHGNSNMKKCFYYLKKLGYTYFKPIDSEFSFKKKNREFMILKRRIDLTAN